MKYKYQLKDALPFGWEGLKGRAYNGKEDFLNASAAYFEITGNHGRVKNTKSDRIYYVLGGHGEFVVGDEVILVEKSDVIIVPTNTEYDYRALDDTLKLFLVHAPAFDPKYDVKI
jgi:mannose-6-phosphate isomerase-like protein (cupin superfamily)